MGSSDNEKYEGKESFHAENVIQDGMITEAYGPSGTLPFLLNLTLR
jgi:hypothetical protein